MPTPLTPDQIEEYERTFELGPDAHNPDFYTQAYDDPIGIPTIGIGHNLPGNPQSDITDLAGNPNYEKVLNGDQRLTEEQVTELYTNDMNRAIDNAQDLVPNFDQLPQSAQWALADMSFNLGPAKLAQFQNMLNALNDGDLAKAAEEMQNSSWFNQVGQRAASDSFLMSPQSLFKDIKEIIKDIMDQAPDFSGLIDWSRPEDSLSLPTEPWDYLVSTSDNLVALNEAGAGESPIDAPGTIDGPGYIEGSDGPGWDGGVLGDPTSYPGSSSDGYSGGGPGDESGDPGDYGEGGSWGGGQAGNGESGGQFGGGYGGYGGEGGYGGYGEGEGGEGEGEGGE